MFEAIKKIISSVITYIIVCGLIFVLSFSFYTKKFPPDFKQLRAGLEGITKITDSLGIIQKQQEELLKVDFNSIPLQLNTTNDVVTALNQKVSIFESQNDYLVKKIQQIEQNNISLVQRIENLERQISK